MSTTPQIDHADTRRPVGTARLSMIGALAFVSFYLAMDFVHGAVATGDRPLPNDPDDIIYRYLVNDSAAVAASAAMMLVSVSGLATFLLATRRTLPVLPNPWGYRFGMLAVAAMAGSVVLSTVLAATASSLPVGAGGVRGWGSLPDLVRNEVEPCMSRCRRICADPGHQRPTRPRSLKVLTLAERSAAGLAWFSRLPEIRDSEVQAPSSNNPSLCTTTFGRLAAEG
jgi:hypothetical protein